MFRLIVKPKGDWKTMKRIGKGRDWELSPLQELEAIRASFKKCWIERDYASIIVVARKLPEEVLLGDTLLCMWYDNAINRIGGPLAAPLS